MNMMISYQELVRTFLKFRKPIYIDDTVVATVVVNTIDKVKRRVFFDTYCKVGKQKVIIGQAEIYIPEKKS